MRDTVCPLLDIVRQIKLTSECVNCVESLCYHEQSDHSFRFLNDSQTFILLIIHKSSLIGESQLTKSTSSVNNSAVANESPSLAFELNLNDDSDVCFCIIDIMANLFHLQTQHSIMS